MFLPWAVLALAANSSLSVPAFRTSQAPRIDGELNDEVWSSAVPVSAFTQQLPLEGAGPSEQTELRLLYDDHHLYVAARMRDRSAANVSARLTRRDRDVGSDAILVDIAPSGAHQMAYHFELSAAGVQRDAIRTGDRSLDYSWDGVWASAARLNPEGWSAELSLPLAMLRHDPTRGALHLQVRRFLSRNNETDALVFIPRSQSWELGRYLPLEGMSDVARTRGIELRPFAGLQLRELREADGASSRLEVLPTYGADARLNIGSGLIIDATVLPDFGQVEADRALLNLSNFEVAFPEKRRFFLDATDLYSVQDAYGEPTDTQLLYSRRIGAAPPPPELSERTVIRAPDQVRLLGAVRMRGTLSDVLSLALLDGLTAEENATVQLSDGTREAETLVPASNFFYAKLRAELGSG